MTDTFRKKEKKELVMRTPHHALSLGLTFHRHRTGAPPNQTWGLKENSAAEQLQCSRINRPRQGNFSKCNDSILSRAAMGRIRIAFSRKNRGKTCVAPALQTGKKRGSNARIPPRSMELITENHVEC
jgi:hypothetical protein